MCEFYDKKECIRNKSSHSNLGRACRSRTTAVSGGVALFCTCIVVLFLVVLLGMFPLTYCFFKHLLGAQAASQ